MKLFSVFRKSVREQRRDLVNLLLVVSIAPFFVLVYWLMYRTAPNTYEVLLIMNDDRQTAAEVTRTLTAKTYADGSTMLKVTPVTDRAEGEKRLKNRKADAMLIIPAGFGKARAETRQLMQGLAEPSGQNVTITLTGDFTNPRYMVAAVTVWTQLDLYINDGMPQSGPIQWNEVALGSSGARSDFELYVPGLLMVAITTLIYRIAMLFTAEVEAGTLRRLQLSRMTAFDLLGGIGLTQVILGIAAVLVTFGTAVALGFQSRGPLWVALLISVITTFASIGVGLLVACFSRNSTEASIVGTFPMLLMMFFSGGFFPLPQVRLLSLGSQVVSLYDLLPITHAVNALNKVMTLGAGLGEVTYELVSVSLLSLIYFAVGVWLFRRKHMVAV